MLISIVFDFACPCGAVNAGLMVHQVRVNKGSIKSVANDRGLGWMPSTCKACKTELPTVAQQSIHGDDLDKVNAFRERKGWPPLKGDLGRIEIVGRRPAGA